ncbi:MAG: hypothetical protein H0X38_01110, partial [Planctomycetes bacterium]|nr:hypothetical protein [Planctomycetota bacterium]
MTRPPPCGFRRSGTVLILVAGISALLAATALAFLARMRGDAEESALLLQDTQARIMLAAACNYIQEGSRIGWDRYPNTGAGSNAGVGTSYPAATDSNDPFPGASPGASGFPVHEETFGWVDTRDGSAGPTTQEGRICYDASLTGTMPWQDTPALRPAWPAPTSVVRCPMQVWRRPPCATQLTASYNPILTDPAQSGNSAYLYPFLSNPDPQPEAGNGWNKATNTVSTLRYDDGLNGATRGDFIHGDPTPRPQTTGKSWFRILREGPATFVITVGAGGTQGFRTYDEAVQQGQGALFSS